MGFADNHSGLEFLVLLGCVSGFISGLLGVGGGAIIVPGLIIGLPLFFGLAGPEIPKIAMATSLALLIPTSIAAVQFHAARGGIDWRMLLLFAPSVIAGAFTISFFAGSLNADALLVLFAGFLVIMALRRLLGLRQGQQTLMPMPPALLPLTARGLLGGAFATSLGLGVAFFAVPVLSRYLAMPRAIGTATALALPMALSGVAGNLLGSAPEICLHNCAGHIFLPAFAAIGIAATLAAPMGAFLAHVLSASALHRIWAMFLIVAAGSLLYRTVSPAAVASEARHLIAAVELLARSERNEVKSAAIPAWLEARGQTAFGSVPDTAAAVRFGPNRAFQRPAILRNHDTSPFAFARNPAWQRAQMGPNRAARMMVRIASQRGVTHFANGAERGEAKPKSRAATLATLTPAPHRGSGASTRPASARPHALPSFNGQSGTTP